MRARSTARRAQPMSPGPPHRIGGAHRPPLTPAMVNIGDPSRHGRRRVGADDTSVVAIRRVAVSTAPRHRPVSVDSVTVSAVRMSMVTTTCSPLSSDATTCTCSGSRIVSTKSPRRRTVSHARLSDTSGGPPRRIVHRFHDHPIGDYSNHLGRKSDQQITRGARQNESRMSAGRCC
jgi:hypothetical protein